MKNKVLISLFLINSFLGAQNFITNERGAQVGDCITSYCLAKILSIKYKENLQYTYTPFIHSELFVFDHEPRIDINHVFSEQIRVFDEGCITNNLNKDNVLFTCHLETKINQIDQPCIDLIKQEVQFKQIPKVNKIPTDVTTMAVHIRKGNGGGQFFDGQQTSLQAFDFNREQVKYLNNYVSYPFDWESYTRNNGHLVCNILENYKEYEPNWSFSGKPVDKVDKWQTKFPPDQFYIDQIIKVSKELNHQKLYVQLFTDDKNPYELITKLKNAVNLENITFFYEDNRNSSYKEQIFRDLYAMSKFDILIRSQSYFSRVAELMGNHKLVIYPLEFKWDDNKLIMNKVVIKGDIEQLKRKLNIGILITATGKYIQFAKEFITGAKKYFLPNHNLKFFLFTDGQYAKEDNVTVLEHKKIGWPYDAMNRYELYTKHKDLFTDLDYIFSCDVDLKFISNIDEAILGDRIALKHPHFENNRRGRYEVNNKESKAYVADHEGQHYFCAGFFGGTKNEFLKMCNKVSCDIESDFKINFVAEVHDESHTNRYFIDNPPTVMLPYTFGCQEELPWEITDKTKILYVYKNHDEVRQ
ncbi:MAG: hypothetical protein P4L22_00405 [Candidatus Babeliales bacterium]|nr:hypothetical protein [Candidatus Babeliales bacterium]